jgi:hypothetical protein
MPWIAAIATSPAIQKAKSVSLDKAKIFDQFSAIPKHTSDGPPKVSRLRYDCIADLHDTRLQAASHVYYVGPRAF